MSAHTAKNPMIQSRQFKNGQELSVGQWQRICIARLFMKDAPIFILEYEGLLEGFLWYSYR